MARGSWVRITLEPLNCSKILSWSLLVSVIIKEVDSLTLPNKDVVKMLSSIDSITLELSEINICVV